jgi:hypothetical protein
VELVHLVYLMIMNKGILTEGETGQEDRKPRYFERVCKIGIFGLD